MGISPSKHPIRRSRVTTLPLLPVVFLLASPGFMANGNLGDDVHVVRAAWGQRACGGIRKVLAHNVITRDWPSSWPVVFGYTSVGTGAWSI